MSNPIDLLNAATIALNSAIVAQEQRDPNDANLAQGQQLLNACSVAITRHAALVQRQTGVPGGPPPQSPTQWLTRYTQIFNALLQCCRAAGVGSLPSLATDATTFASLVTATQSALAFFRGPGTGPVLGDSPNAPEYYETSTQLGYLQAEWAANPSAPPTVGSAGLLGGFPTVTPSVGDDSILLSLAARANAYASLLSS